MHLPAYSAHIIHHEANIYTERRNIMGGMGMGGGMGGM